MVKKRGISRQFTARRMGRPPGVESVESGSLTMAAYNPQSGDMFCPQNKKLLSNIWEVLH